MTTSQATKQAGSYSLKLYQDPDSGYWLIEADDNDPQSYDSEEEARTAFEGMVDDATVEAEFGWED